MSQSSSRFVDFPLSHMCCLNSSFFKSGSLTKLGGLIPAFARIVTHFAFCNKSAAHCKHGSHCHPAMSAESHAIFSPSQYSGFLPSSSLCSLHVFSSSNDRARQCPFLHVLSSAPSAPNAKVASFPFPPVRSLNIISSPSPNLKSIPKCPSK